MFFLLNNRVFSTSAGAKLVTDLGLPAQLASHGTLADAVLAVQTAMFEDPQFVIAQPEKAAALAWLIASRSRATAALFIVAPKIKKPQQVAFRLAEVSLSTLGGLAAIQKEGRLNDAVVNQAVWQAAA